MKYLFRTIGLFLFVIYSSSSFAWVDHQNVTITRLIQFEGGIGRDYTVLEFSNNGARCRIPHEYKELLSFALATHFASKSVSVVCHDSQEDPGGSAFPSHKLHRIFTN